MDSAEAAPNCHSLTHYFSVLAEAFQASGNTDEALKAVDDGLALAARSNERFHESNLQRLRGDLLLNASGGGLAEAEKCYRRAVDIARLQSAKSWELRAMISLCRLRQRSGDHDEGREHLADVYNWFTEGFETPDLLEAEELLKKLNRSNSE